MVSTSSRCDPTNTVDQLEMKLQLYLLLLTAIVLGTSMNGARVYAADKEHAEKETETPLTGAWGGGGGDRWGGDGGDRWHGGGGGGGGRWQGGGRKW
nr:unnamed protein product [Spirometra erinaceieuropaei]